MHARQAEVGWMGLAMGLGGAGSGGRGENIASLSCARLTTAILLVADRAPTARVLCRRAVRNIVKEDAGVPKRKEKTIAIGLQLCGEEI